MFSTLIVDSEAYALDAVRKQHRHNHELADIIHEELSKINTVLMPTESTATSLHIGVDPDVLQQLFHNVHVALKSHYMSYSRALDDIFTRRDLPGAVAELSINDAEITALNSEIYGDVARHALLLDMQTTLLSRDNNTKNSATSSPLLLLSIPAIRSAYSALHSLCKTAAQNAATNESACLADVFTALRDVLNFFPDLVRDVLTKDSAVEDDASLANEVHAAVREARAAEELSALASMDGNIDDSLKKHEATAALYHKGCVLLHARAESLDTRLQTANKATHKFVKRLEGFLRQTARLKQKWRETRGLCVKDLTVMHDGMFSQDTKDADRTSELEERLYAVQQRIENYEAKMISIVKGAARECVGGEGRDGVTPPAETRAHLRVLAREYSSDVQSYRNLVESRREEQTKYRGFLDVCTSRCTVLESAIARCTFLCEIVMSIEIPVRDLVVMIKRDVLDKRRRDLSALVWRVRADVLALSRKLYLVAGILMYKIKTRAEVSTEPELAASPSSQVSVVKRLQGIVEDASVLYSGVTEALQADGIENPFEDPMRQLETLLNQRRGDVQKYLQRSTNSTPMLDPVD
eukprot:PhM_4_TR6911/c0_g1_i1/m.28212